MKRIKTADSNTFIFDSIEDAVSYGTNSKAPWQQSKTNSADFAFSRNWDHHVELMTTGWADGRKQFADARRDSGVPISAPMVESFEAAFDVCGSVVDMGRYVDGEPENMLDYRLEEIEGAGNIITILAGGCVAGWTSTDSMVRYGVALACTIDLLESSGYRVELMVAYSTKHGRFEQGTGKRYLNSVVPIKRSDEPLDVERFVKTLVCPSWFRRGMFRVDEAMVYELSGGKHTMEGLTVGYGTVNWELDELAKVLDAHTVIGGVNGDNHHNSVKEHMLNMLGAVGHADLADFYA
jgi:hypothetical protein